MGAGGARLPAQKNVQYDPWDWVTYKNSQFVSSITEGREYIYFGTNGGILRYQIFGKYWDFPITQSQGLSNDDVSAVYYDFYTHILWASTSWGLDYSMEGGTRWDLVTNETLALRPGERIVRIGSTSDYLWCVTTSQILKLDHLSGFVITPYAEPPEEGVSWGSTFMDSDRKNLKILRGFTATRGWINDFGVLHGPQLEEVRVSTLFMDRFGDLWVGTWGSSVFYGDYQMKFLEPIPFGPAQTSAEIVLKKNHQMWIGGIDQSSLYSGLTFYNVQRGIWDLFRLGYEIQFGEDQVYYGASVRDEWWFGTPNGIQIYMPGKDSWVSISQSRGLPDSRVVTLASDGDYVYVGTLTGLIRMSAESRTRVSWEAEELTRLRPVYVVHWDGENLWISTDIDLWMWVAGEDQFHHWGMVVDEKEEDVSDLSQPLPDILSPVTAIVSSDTMVYFGDEFGVLSHHKKTGEWARLTGESSLVGHQILSLALSEDTEDEGSFLWIGTAEGVFVLNLNTGYIRHFQTEDGLPGDAVRSIVIMGNIAWFGTPGGLGRFSWKKHFK